MRTSKGDPRWQVDVKPEDLNKRDNLTSAEHYRKSVAGGTIGTVTNKRPRLRQQHCPDRRVASDNLLHVSVIATRLLFRKDPNLNPCMGESDSTSL